MLGSEGMHLQPIPNHFTLVAICGCNSHTGFPLFGFLSARSLLKLSASHFLSCNACDVVKIIKDDARYMSQRV